METEIRENLRRIRVLLRQGGVPEQEVDDATQDLVVAMLEASLRSWQFRPPGACEMFARVLVEQKQARRALPRLTAHPDLEQGAPMAPSPEALAIAAETVWIDGLAREREEMAGTGASAAAPP